MHWYERQPERWRAEQRIASQLLDGSCNGIDADGVAFVEGVFHVRSGHGHVYESVTIRIEYPHSFPDRGQPPRVVLLSHRDRWEVCADAHIYSDWSLCLFVPGETPVDFSRADSLTGLFAVLHTFLFKEHLFQRALKRQLVTGVVPEWPGESRSHGRTGVAEAVREIGKVGRNEPCPCGSGRKFKVCCMRLIGR